MWLGLESPLIGSVSPTIDLTYLGQVLLKVISFPVTWHSRLLSAASYYNMRKYNNGSFIPIPQKTIYLEETVRLPE